MVFIEGATLPVVKFYVNISLLGDEVEDIVSHSEDQVGRDESASALAKILGLSLEFEGECSDMPVNGQVHFLLWNSVKSITKADFFQVLITIIVPHLIKY